MARSASLKAHSQICRCCNAYKPASDFGDGDSFCHDCRVLIGPLMRNGSATPPASGSPTPPFNVVNARARLAMRRHATSLDGVLAALFADGGFDAVYYGTSEAMKRLALSRRGELGNWVM
jgi:hypothetical protein